MKRAMTNYWVDMITGIAFVFCAATGLMRLFPEATVGLSSSGQSVILGIPVTYWQTVHDWSGVVMAAGVGAHAVLHFKWLVSMTGRVARGETKTSRSRANPPAAAAATDLAASAVAAGPAAIGEAAGGAALSALRPVALREHPDLPARRGITRKGFLAAAGVAGVAALVGGWTAFGGESDSSGASSSSTTSQTHAGRGNGNGNGSGNGTSSASSTGTGDTASSATAVSAERVVIDAGACTGCERCVRSCPYGILAMSGDKAVVLNADACQLCGRCVSVCQPQAITLNY